MISYDFFKVNSNYYETRTLQTTIKFMPKVISCTVSHMRRDLSVFVFTPSRSLYFYASLSYIVLASSVYFHLGASPFPSVYSSSYICLQCHCTFSENIPHIQLVSSLFWLVRPPLISRKFILLAARLQGLCYSTYASCLSHYVQMKN